MADLLPRLEQTLGSRYRIVGELGEGGMATVFVAEDLKHERQVAIKVLKPALAAVVGADRFLAEIKTTAQLQHPGILPLFDSGEANGFLYYVMPYVDGESLRDRLKRDHQLPIDQAVRIARQVAEALAYAHDKGVVHRDIKPANILLSGDQPVVADFGIALALSAAGSGRLTETGLWLGTPHYMSPEQATGEEWVGAQTDNYALTCVLYEMLVGEPPYTGTTAQAVLGKILTGDVVPPTRLRRQVPRHVEAVILRGLERLPADRFRDARELADALDDPGFTFDPVGTYQSASDRQVRQGSRWIRSLAIVLVGALVGVWLWSSLGPTATPEAQLAFYEVNLPPGEPLTEFTVSLDRRSIVYAMGDGAVYHRRLATLDDQPLTSAANAESMSISPDGEWLAYAVRDGADFLIQKVRLSGGPAITLAAHHYVRGLAWASPDELLVGSHRSGLRSVAATGGELRRVTTTEGGPPHRYPQALPDGRGVLFHIGGSGVGDEVAVLPAGESQWRVLTSGTHAQYAESGHILFYREGSLWAAGFDLGRLELTSEPIPVGDVGVRRLQPLFDVSSDGILYYAATRPARNDTVVWVDRMGTEESVGLAAGQYMAPELSPDGRRLLARRHADTEQIWVYDLQRGAGEPVTGEAFSQWYAIWSPDGNDIVFMSRRTGPFRMYRVAASGVGDIEPLGIAGFPYDWTPSGGLLFGAEDTEDLVVRDLATGAQSTVLTYDRFDQGFTRLSPDGRFLVYEVTNATGEPVIEVRPFPDVDRGRWPIETVGAHDPKWSPDGRELYFRAGMSFLRVPVDPDAQSPPGSPEPLFEGPYTDFDVGPDGRFLMIRPTGEEVELRERIIVAVDWLDELERLVPR